MHVVFDELSFGYSHAVLYNASENAHPGFHLRSGEEWQISLLGLIV